MEPLYAYLQERPSTEKYYHPAQYLYFTTTDEHRSSFKLDRKDIKPFLAKYVTLLERGATLHLNLQLHALDQHALCIHVNFAPIQGTSTIFPDIQPESYGKLYKEVVFQIKNEMMIQGEEVDDRYFLDAFLLTVSGFPHFKLMFPRVYLNRFDYDVLMTRVGQWLTKMSVVRGWMMYGSRKQQSQMDYRVTGLFPSGYTSYLSGHRLDLLIKGRYPRKSQIHIYSHMLFPVNVPGMHTGHLVVYPIWETQDPIPSPAYQILQYDDNNAHSHLYAVGKSQELSHGTRWPHTLFKWCKRYQNQYDFRSLNKIVKNYLYQTYPPRFRGQRANPKRILASPSVKHLSSVWKTLYVSLHPAYSVAQFTQVMNHYLKDYESVIHEILNGSLYTIHSLSYALANQFGVLLDTFNEIYVSEKLLDRLKRIYEADNLTDFKLHLVVILHTIPYALHGKNIHVFRWATRDWKMTTSITTFAKKLTHALVDMILYQMTDSDAKQDGLSRRGTYLATFTAIKAALHEQAQLVFDNNPHVWGLPQGEVLPANGAPRPAIPEDRVWRTLGFGFDYPDPALFEVFWSRQEYLSAFHRLKSHVSGDTSIHTFQETFTEAIDDLLAYFCLLFCEQYEALDRFLSYLAQALLGRPQSPQILCLIGEPDRGMKTLAELTGLVLGDYSGSLTADRFSLKSGKDRKRPRAKEEMARHPGCRLWIVEPLTSPINASILQSLFEPTGQDVGPAPILFTTTQDPATLPSALHAKVPFESTFLSSVTTYDFTTRVFPAQQNLAERLGPPFTSLIIHLMRRKQAAGQPPVLV